MQRFCTKLRSLALPSTQNLSLLSSNRLLLRSSPLLHQRVHFAASSQWSPSTPRYNASFSPIHSPSLDSFLSLRCSSYFPLSLVHVRHVSSRERRKKRKPMTPVTSKLKKVKMKAYSSYKDRFRTLNDGTIRRWREGKNHNAHLKSRKARRRLRKPSIVPPAYAKVMKKLNFCG